jgi:hypothetical protein
VAGCASASSWAPRAAARDPGQASRRRPRPGAAGQGRLHRRAGDQPYRPAPERTLYALTDAGHRELLRRRFGRLATQRCELRDLITNPETDWRPRWYAFYGEPANAHESQESGSRRCWREGECRATDCIRDPGRAHRPVRSAVPRTPQATGSLPCRPTRRWGVQLSEPADRYTEPDDLGAAAQPLGRHHARPPDGNHRLGHPQASTARVSRPGWRCIPRRIGASSGGQRGGGRLEHRPGGAPPASAPAAIAALVSPWSR